MSNIILRFANPYGLGQRIDSGVGAIADVSRAFNEACNVDNICTYPVFNIGSGQGISINELTKLISCVFDKEALLKYLNKREFDVIYNVLI